LPAKILTLQFLNYVMDMVLQIKHINHFQNKLILQQTGDNVSKTSNPIHQACIELTLHYISKSYISTIYFFTLMNKDKLVMNSWFPTFIRSE
jgi:hypothetical protein